MPKSNFQNIDPDSIKLNGYYKHCFRQTATDLFVIDGQNVISSIPKSLQFGFASGILIGFVLTGPAGIPAGAMVGLARGAIIVVIRTGVFAGKIIATSLFTCTTRNFIENAMLKKWIENLNALNALETKIKCMLFQIIINAYSLTAKNSSMASLTMLSKLQELSTIDEKEKILLEYMFTLNLENFLIHNGKKFFEITGLTLETLILFSSKITTQISPVLEQPSTLIQFDKNGMIGKISDGVNELDIPEPQALSIDVKNTIESFDDWQAEIFFQYVMFVYKCKIFSSSQESTNLINVLETSTSSDFKKTSVITYFFAPNNRRRKLYNVIEQSAIFYGKAMTNLCDTYTL